MRWENGSQLHCMSAGSGCQTARSGDRESSRRGRPERERPSPLLWPVSRPSQHAVRWENGSQLHCMSAGSGCQTARSGDRESSRRGRPERERPSPLLWPVSRPSQHAVRWENGSQLHCMSAGSGCQTARSGDWEPSRRGKTEQGARRSESSLISLLLTTDYLLLTAPSRFLPNSGLDTEQLFCYTIRTIVLLSSRVAPSSLDVARKDH